MEWINNLPVWVIGAAIFCFRMVDVSMGTMRVISVVHGRRNVAVVLGFFEILIWVTVLSGLILRVGENPILAVMYAGGFAAGNALGIKLERRIALGTSVILMISRTEGRKIAQTLRKLGQRLTTVEGEGRDGPRTLLYVTTARKDLSRIIETARQVDPGLFYVADHCSETSYSSQLNESPLGAKAFFKRK